MLFIKVLQMCLSGKYYFLCAKARFNFFDALLHECVPQILFSVCFCYNDSAYRNVWVFFIGRHNARASDKQLRIVDEHVKRFLIEVVEVLVYTILLYHKDFAAQL